MVWATEKLTDSAEVVFSAARIISTFIKLMKQKYQSTHQI